MYAVGRPQSGLGAVLRGAVWNNSSQLQRRKVGRFGNALRIRAARPSLPARRREVLLRNTGCPNNPRRRRPVPMIPEISGRLRHWHNSGVWYALLGDDGLRAFLVYRFQDVRSAASIPFEIRNLNIVCHPYFPESVCPVHHLREGRQAKPQSHHGTRIESNSLCRMLLCGTGRRAINPSAWLTDPTLLACFIWTQAGLWSSIAGLA